MTLLSCSLITLTSSCFLPYLPSFCLSVFRPPPFSTFWHLLDSDKQGSKYLASLLFPSSSPLSRAASSRCPCQPSMASLQQQILLPLSALSCWACLPSAITFPFSFFFFFFFLFSKLSAAGSLSSFIHSQMLTWSSCLTSGCPTKGLEVRRRGEYARSGLATEI